MSSLHAAMRLAGFPSTGSGNPYIDNFYAAMEPAGVQLVHPKGFTFGWLVGERADYDAVHLHWLHLYYDNPSLILTWKRLFEFVFKILALVMMRKNIFYTLHNLYPHSSRSSVADRIARLVVIRTADLVIVHSRQAKDIAKVEFGNEEKYVVMRHGDYRSNYQRNANRQDARESLGLKGDHRVVLFLGNVKAYKGILELVEAFAGTENEKYRLIVAGRIDSDIADDIKRQAAYDKRVITDDAFIADEKVADYFAAADLMVLPFRKTLTSGSLVLSYSFKCPVLIPDIEELKDYTIDGLTYFYRENLQEGIEEALDIIEEMSDADWQHAMQPYCWKSCVEPVIDRLVKMES